MAALLRSFGSAKFRDLRLGVASPILPLHAGGLIKLRPTRISLFLRNKQLVSDRSRAPLRNGIARLWWYGYCSYDETLDDPFELTDALLKKLDVTQNILENAFGKNNQVTQAVLRVLLEREKKGKSFYVLNQVRELVRYIVQIGGVTIVDALDAAELREIVLGKIDQLSSASVPA